MVLCTTNNFLHYLLIMFTSIWYISLNKDVLLIKSTTYIINIIFYELTQAIFVFGTNLTAFICQLFYSTYIGI